MAVKEKCTYCGINTEDWEIVNGGPVRCWDCGRKIREKEKAAQEAKKSGCFNKSADRVKRVNKTWSDCNLTENYAPTKSKSFERLMCKVCGGISFEVLATGDYETSAKCNKCGMYYIVHTG